MLEKLDDALSTFLETVERPLKLREIEAIQWARGNNAALLQGSGGSADFSERRSTNPLHAVIGLHKVLRHMAEAAQRLTREP